MGDRRRPDNFQGVNAAALEATVMKIIRGLGAWYRDWIFIVFMLWLNIGCLTFWKTL